MQIVSTNDKKSVTLWLRNLKYRSPFSHKGDNGKVLIIGGSTLFHAASFWAAEIASHFVDIVHYASTAENNLIFRRTKKHFHNGIVVSRDHLDRYLQEDNAVCIGPGMVRASSDVTDSTVEGEAQYTQTITRHILKSYPKIHKVLDAGALQMIAPNDLSQFSDPESTIITPHRVEFEQLFNVSLNNTTLDQKINIVLKEAKKQNVTILLKAVDDIVSDGDQVVVIRGGNSGLTKGGTGDILAGLCVSLFAQNSSIVSAVASSILLKSTADHLFERSGYWYNNDDLLQNIPVVLKNYIIINT